MNPSYTEHPSAEAMAFLAERAAQGALDASLARRRAIREDRAACARKGRA